jgi:protein AroM
MDCIGYTSAMKKLLAEVTGKNVLLSRTLLAHVAAELIGC